MNILMQAALQEISNLTSGEIFIVKDLFKGYEWNRLNINDRRNLGRFFVEPSQNIFLFNGDIEILEKNKSGQQMYKKL